MNALGALVVLSLASLTLSQQNPNFAPDRNSIVHLFEWKWDDIGDECERFLQVKGYAGVQTSPPNENLVLTSPFRPWYERYQPVSYQLTTRSGDEEAFGRMTRRCNDVGVRIYPDIVLNHMSSGSGTGTAGSTADFEGHSFPSVPYGPNDFHPDCPVDNFQDPENVWNCQLSGLLDLNQTSEYVREKIADYLNHLIDLGVAGFRIDAAKHVNPDDLASIFSRLKDLNTDHGFAPGSRAYVFQEVPDYGGEPVNKYLYTDTGSVIEFLYGSYLGNVFIGNDRLAVLENWGTEWGLLDGSEAVAFIDNHDNQRTGGPEILTYKNPRLYKMAIAFMLAHPYGTTRLMSSFDFTDFSQGPPADANGNIISPTINADNTCGSGYVCEHRWREIFSMVGFRNTVEGTEITNWWSNGDQQIAFCRGDRGFIAVNNGGDLNTDLQTCLPAGIYCDVISGDLIDGECTGKVVTVRDDGTASIVIMAEDFDGAMAIHVNAKVVV